jgi:hypothetical protein
MRVDTRDRPRRRRVVRFGRRLAVLAAASAFTVLLAEHTTTAAFTAQTGSTNQAATATTFCTSVGSTTGPLTATLDSAIYEVNPANNYSNTAIGVGTGANGDAYALLKFPTLSPPPRCKVATATLYVYVRTPSTGPATINVHRASQPWTNANTWATLPRPVGAGTPVGMPTATGWIAWQVPTLTQELVDGPDYGFLLKDSVDHHPTVTRYQTFESLESYPTRAAYLVVTWG